jgi:UDP-3-O-[3-hydroxymyristoyl] glucosamine N-acyltransferase
MGSTFIRKGVKIDNLVHIAHNADIGENTVIAGQSGVSGSTKIDKQCVIGGQVGFVGHLYIAPGSQFGAQSGVSKSIKEPNKKWNGSPATDYMESLRVLAKSRSIPSLEDRIKQLENTVNQLLQKND